MIPFRVSLGDWSPVIRRIDDGQSAIALTFDDGPDPAGTPHLIATLAAAKARASFFLCGIRVAQHPEQVQALVDAGHDVYAHGWDHNRFAAQEGEAALQATLRTEALLARHRPTPKPYLIRLPYNAGFTSAAVHRAMRKFDPDIQFAWWSHAIADYLIADKPRSETEVRDACSAAVARLTQRDDLAGGILLLHDTAITQPHEAAALTTRTLLPGLLEALARRGLRAVALEPRAMPPAVNRFVFRTLQPYTVTPDWAHSA